MHLIITEKNISAERISKILAGKEKVTVGKDGGISSYSFNDKVVAGLRGHVVEVDFEPGYSNWRSEEHTPRSLIDAGTIKVPTEKKIIHLIQKLAKKAARVTIATDFDTEGELIGKEAYELIRAVNPKVKVDRSRFSAITPEEIHQAFSNTTEIDFALAAAGEARQVIDLMWGASLTRFISLAARRGGANILSVGRVQSPTLAMIVDREKEIEAFVAEKYWQLSLTTEKSGGTVEARHTTARFTDKMAAETAHARTMEPLVVTEIKESQKTDRAPTPFDTTGFIVAAARLGFSAANSMRIAEDLYMNGFISYPRTDNTVYPKTLDLNGVLKTLGQSVFSTDVAWVMAHRRPVPTAGKKSTTDHPPIHPTGIATREAIGDDRWKVYELVVRRFLATLSLDAQWKTMKVNFDAGGEPYTTTGGVLVEPGWRKVYPYSEAKDHVLPTFTEGEKLPIKEKRLEEKETLPPPRYTQAKLIQRMEELGLGTKSTRHEVIGKLVSRKYVEGNPLRPSLVGMAVIGSLEDHADTITRPDMTQMLEEHMNLIKERQRNRDDVVRESREMLHRVFDQLEAHGQEIGDEIMDQTAEEMTLGPCPVCGKDIRIRHLRSQAQFIGCTNYPECTFNIGLPMVMWGFAVRTDTICPKHGLHHVTLVKKGARPWEIGCPLCHHISSNRETLDLVPSMTDDAREKLHKKHIYTVYEVAKSGPEGVMAATGLSRESAEKLVNGAEEVLVLLRKRSECRKFVRKHLPPRRGRSHSTIVKKLHAAGIDDVEGLVGAERQLLRSVGMGEVEAENLQAEAKRITNERLLRDIGIPAVSLKKYHQAGIITPLDFIGHHPASISEMTGINPETVYRHVEMVAKALDKPAPEKISKVQLERGKAELLAIRGIGEAALGKLYRAGIFSGDRLDKASPDELSKKTGIPKEKILEYQKEYRAVAKA
ncbi:MAG: DNA topoisomerase I [Methanoregulaceae archaeon]|jgi:DNA topoisomerase-1|nr:DNA topoisomerase I [Methanoregulaceae archaeon]